MSQLLRFLVILGLSLSPLCAQAPKPEAKTLPAPTWVPPVLKPADTSMPEASAAFSAMVQKVYRSREYGLASLSAQVEMERRRLDGTGKPERAGPWTLKWKHTGDVAVTDVAGKPVSGDFTRILGDLVGHSIAGAIEGRELRQDAKKHLLLGPVPKTPAEFRPAALFTLDAKGRLGTQLIFQKDGSYQRRDYVYRTRADKYLVHRSTLRLIGPKGQIQGEAPTTYTWTEVEGYAFPKTVVTSAGGAVQTVTYSKLKPVRLPVKPKPKEKAKPAPQDSSGG